MKRIFVIAKHLFTLLRRNAFRTFLLIIGFIITSVAFSAGDIIVSNVSMSSSVYYKNFPQNAILLKGSVNNNLLQKLNIFDTQLKISSCLILGTDVIKLENEQELKINEYEVLPNFEQYPLVSVDTNDSLEVSSLIAGRSFDQTDCLLQRKVVILHNAVIQMLFEENDVIGKNIVLGDGSQYQIIGILKDTPDILRLVHEFLSSGEGNLPVYFPCSGSYYNHTVCIAPENLTHSYASKLVEFIQQEGGNITVFAYTAALHNAKIMQNVKDAESELLILLVVMYLISTVFIFSLMLFFVKERVVEIGIRKAIGGKSQDITFQFMFELFMVALFSSIIGTILGNFLGSVIAFLMTSAMGTHFVQIKLTAIILPVLIDLTIAMIAGLIPSIIASKMNVKECLQFD